MTEPDPDLVVSERAGIIAWAFAKGEQMTTRQAATRVGITYMGAWLLLQKLSRVLPLGFDQQSEFDEGYWYPVP